MEPSGRGLMGSLFGKKTAERRSGTTPASRGKRSASKLGGGRSVAANAPDSPLPPVGMAAASRGRFLSAAEFDAQSRRATDSGLDDLCDTPDFKRWMRTNAGRIHVGGTDSDDEA